MKKWILIKSLLYLIILFVLLLVSHALAGSLNPEEVYTSLDGKKRIEVVSENELEIIKGQDILLSHYSFRGDKLRIVYAKHGTKIVEYYELLSDGLKDKDGNILYSINGLTLRKRQLLVDAFKWFDDVAIETKGSGRAECAYGHATLKKLYSIKPVIRSYIPKYIIDITCDRFNFNIFCVSAGVTYYSHHSFFMHIISDIWLKCKKYSNTGWISSKWVKANFYGFKVNHERRYAIFKLRRNKDRIEYYDAPNGKSIGFMVPRESDSKLLIVEEKEGWVRTRQDIWFRMTKEFGRIDIEPAIPWEGEIIAQDTIMYSEPNDNSNHLMKLQRGEKVIVISMGHGKKHYCYKSVNNKKLREALCDIKSTRRR